MRAAWPAGPLLAALLVAAAAVASCGPAGSSAAPGTAPAGTLATRDPGADGVALRVYAAASLRNAVDGLVRAYGSSHPATSITVSTDSSAALAARIEEGAPADLFLSADTRNPQRLVDAGLAAGDVTVFAGNELALIVPAGNPGGVRTPADLASPGLKVIAAAAEVPITGYTSRLLDQLAALDAYPDDFGARVEANVVSREDNVGGIVAKVALGEGDAGIVYATDALSATGVTTIPIPAGQNVTASYGAVALREASEPEAAAEFLAWLATPAAQEVLASFGFRPVA